MDLTGSVDWIVNCAGVVKSECEGRESDAVLVNSALPHWLEDSGVGVIQISTDCVFSGKGKPRVKRDGSSGLTTQDDPDPVDFYGATKLAGELEGKRSITLRTSFIGWENGTQRGLLEWFVMNKGLAVTGFKNSHWSGLSAREVARAILKMIERADHPGQSLYHLAGGALSKYDLLHLLNEKLDLSIKITGHDDWPPVYRALDGSLFNRDFNYSPPTWEEMAEELARERPT